MADSARKQKLKRIEIRLHQFRQDHIDELINTQIGLIDSWMKDSIIPYTDWEFNGLNLYVYGYTENTHKTHLQGRELFRLEVYNLDELYEAIPGFQRTMIELTSLGFHKEPDNFTDN